MDPMSCQSPLLLTSKESNIDTVDSWIQLMSVTGMVHGATLSYTRFIGIADVARWRNACSIGEATKTLCCVIHSGRWPTKKLSTSFQKRWLIGLARCTKMRIVADMQDLATLSKEQLLEVLGEQGKEVIRRDDVIQQLEAKIDELKKDYLKLWQERFAAKSERYLSDADQLRIDFDDTDEAADAAEGLRVVACEQVPRGVAELTARDPLRRRMVVVVLEDVVALGSQGADAEQRGEREARRGHVGRLRSRKGGCAGEWVPE